MRDPVDSDTKDLRAWLVKATSGQAEGLRRQIVESASKANVEVVVMDADMVFGSDHIRSALYHARKAMREGRNASESLAMETLLYASGERQLSTAIKKMSVGAGSGCLVVAQLSAGDLDKADNWEPLEEAKTEFRPGDLARFGISKEQLATVGPEKALELVLEKVGSVDVLKK